MCSSNSQNAWYLREDQNLSLFKSDDDLFKIDFHNRVEALVDDSGENINDRSKERGVYLYIDQTCNWIIHAGCTCTSFGQRHKEHVKGAKLDAEKSKESTLYCSYPHSDIEVQGALATLQRGKWSDLQMVTGVRWAKEDKQSVVDLFVWDRNVLGGLNRNKMKASLLDKQEKMVAYLFETVLGLCIAGSKNISSNPSFESFNGSFAG